MDFAHVLHVQSDSVALSARVERLGLLPDPSAPLTWSGLKSRVPKCDEPVNKIDSNDVYETLLGDVRMKDKEWDSLSLEVWPARTKTDLALRRTRLRDYVEHARRVGKLHDIREVFRESRLGWDIIFVTNLCVGVCVFGIEWFKRWRWLGATEGGLSRWIQVAKAVNDAIKVSGLQDDKWRNYVECGVFGGYRNPPFPGFDVFREARALAQGGDPHDYCGHSWTSLVEEALPIKPRKVDFIPFTEWVKSAVWLTTGASTVGYGTFKMPDGTEIKVKARKNMVADLIELETLATDALKTSKQENFTIIKSELGKMRIAVSGDIYTYLKMSWLNIYFDGCYNSWPGATTEENLKGQTKRMVEMLRLAAERYSLPYDYDGFDHQPTTFEIQGILRHMLFKTRAVVDPTGWPEFDAIAANVLSGFDDAWLITRQGNETERVRVTGGLMSGLRWTSLVGNAWNTVMTRLAVKLLVALGASEADIAGYIRGDDSAIFTRTWAQGTLMNEAYRTIGVRGGEGKFALKRGSTEFLRVWYQGKCSGYPARVLPGLVQRKPWSNEPWEPAGVIKAVYGQIRTLERRVGYSLGDLWKTLASRWSRLHSLPVQALSVPESRGGLGITEARADSFGRIVPPIPRSEAVAGVVPLNQTSWREGVLRERAESYGLQRPEPFLKQLAQKELVELLSTDSIPGVARFARSAWDYLVRRGRHRFIRERVTMVGTVQPKVPQPEAATLSTWLSLVKQGAPTFGSCPEVSLAREDFARFEVGGSFKEWLKVHFPRVYDRMGWFHKSWHMSEKLDYLAGKLAGVTGRVNPQLAPIVYKAVAVSARPSSNVERSCIPLVVSKFDEWVYYSDLSLRVYDW